MATMPPSFALLVSANVHSLTQCPGSLWYGLHRVKIGPCGPVKAPAAPPDVQ